MTNREKIPNRPFFRIGDVAELLGVKASVLRYWESEFSMIRPEKSASGQRLYRRNDVEALFLIKRLLHQDQYSIEGAKKRIKALRKNNSIVVPSVRSPEDLKTIRLLAKEIQFLLKTSISELFLY